MIYTFCRYEIMEIKHGRAAMLGFLHVIAIEAGVRLPGYLSVSQDLKFSDVPAGCFASLEAVPTAGWLQIMVLTFAIAVPSTGGVDRPAKRGLVLAYIDADVSKWILIFGTKDMFSLALVHIRNVLP